MFSVSLRDIRDGEMIMNQTTIECIKKKNTEYVISSAEIIIIIKKKKQ